MDTGPSVFVFFTFLDTSFDSGGLYRGLLAADERQCIPSLFLTIKLHIFALRIRIDKTLVISFNIQVYPIACKNRSVSVKADSAGYILEHARALTKYDTPSIFS